MNANKTFLDVVFNRHSCRNFDKKAIITDFTPIINCIDKAPSAGGLKSYDYFFYTDIKKRRTLGKIAYRQTWIANASAIFVFCANFNKPKEKYIKRGNLYAMQDATIACAYAQLAVELMGLRSCWIGAFSPVKLRAYLGLEKHLLPIALLPIGVEKK